MLKKTVISCIVVLSMVFAVNSFAIEEMPYSPYADANAVLVQESNSRDINEAMDARPNAGPVPIPGQPSFFTNPTPDGSFIPMKDILQFGHVFTEGALEEMARGGSVRTNYAVGNSDDFVKRADGKKILILFMEKPAGDFIAYADAEAKNGKTSSRQVLGALGLKAIRDGANVLYIYKEGAHRKIEAFGWGLGASGTVTSETAMTTGGTGVSGGNSGPEDRPWLHGAAFVDPDIKL